MRVMASALSVLLCVSLAAACSAPPISSNDAPAAPAESIQSDRQELATAAYSQIVESFGTPEPGDAGFSWYPEEFGDAFYADGYLHVCLTDISQEMQEKYRALVDTPEILQFQEVTHAYRDLFALQTAISDMAGLRFSSVGINIQENRVDVGLPDLSKAGEALALITENLPSDISALFSEGTAYPICFHQEANATFVSC